MELATGARYIFSFDRRHLTLQRSAIPHDCRNNNYFIPGIVYPKSIRQKKTYLDQTPVLALSLYLDATSRIAVKSYKYDTKGRCQSKRCQLYRGHLEGPAKKGVC